MYEKTIYHIEKEEKSFLYPRGGYVIREGDRFIKFYVRKSSAEKYLGKLEETENALFLQHESVQSATVA